MLAPTEPSHRVLVLGHFRSSPRCRFGEHGMFRPHRKLDERRSTSKRPVPIGSILTDARGNCTADVFIDGRFRLAVFVSPTTGRHSRFCRSRSRHRSVAAAQRGRRTPVRCQLSELLSIPSTFGCGILSTKSRAIDAFVYHTSGTVNDKVISPLRAIGLTTLEPQRPPRRRCARRQRRPEYLLGGELQAWVVVRIAHSEWRIIVGTASVCLLPHLNSELVSPSATT